MKFAEHLSAHITPEWKKQYISYEEMKEMLYKALETQMAAEVADQEALSRYRTSIDELFLKECEKQLNKINTFFAEKMAEAIRKFATLQNELDLLKAKGRIDTRKMHDLKMAFSEFYLSLVLLQNYQNLNFTGFRKILKKHDKLFETDSGYKWKCEHVDSAPFYTNKQISSLIDETEAVFTAELELGDRQRAMKRLRVPPLNEQQSPWVTFKVGFFTGAFVVLLVVIICSGLYRAHNADSTMLNHPSWRYMLRLYRGPFLVWLILLLIGFNVRGWKSAGVNHVLIFELDPRDHLSDQELIEIATIFAVFWSLSITCYLYSDIIGLPALIHPVILVGGMLLFWLNPFKCLAYEARFWLMRKLYRVLTAPIYRVAFADFWLADQLNSLVPLLMDAQYFTCFYYHYFTTSGSIPKPEDRLCISSPFFIIWIRALVSCLPAWFRFAQCVRRWKDDRRGPFPHLVNAGKYSTTFFVVIFASLNQWSSRNREYQSPLSNPFFICWIFSLCFSSVYTYIWDVKMDWGLLDTEHKGLREEIVYSTPTIYYVAIFQDFILRFAWTLSVSLTEVGLIQEELMQCILAPIEVFRRFIWNFFRLENEHLNNCGEFRAVRDISIAPIHADDQARIIKMMDDPDGVGRRSLITLGKMRAANPSRLQSRFRTHRAKSAADVKLLITHET